MTQLERAVDKLERLLKEYQLKRCSHCNTMFPASCLDRVGTIGKQEIKDLLCPGCMYSFKHGAPRYWNEE